MSTPRDSINRPAVVAFDDPDFDEEILFDDFVLGQEPFLSDNAEHLASSEPNRDGLFESLHELNEELDPRAHADNQRSSASHPELDRFAVLESLKALEIYNATATITKRETPASDQQQAEPTLLEDHLSPGAISVPNNVSPSLGLEGQIVANAELVHMYSPNQQAIQSGSHSLSPQTMASKTATGQYQHANDDHTVTTNPILLSSSKKREHSTLTEGHMPTTGKRSLDFWKDTFTPGMFPDVPNPSLLQADPIPLDGFVVNARQALPPTKKQKRVGLPPNSRTATNAPKVARDTAYRGHPTAEGVACPRKRTRTRIEDMDPSMVHVCNFPGCTKKFAKKYNLKIHQRRHNGDLPFLCEYTGCAKRFMWLSSFSRHLRVHEARQNGGRRRRDLQTEAEGDPGRNGSALEQEPDIAISENFSIVSVAGVKILVENDVSEDVTFACALTALDSKPCDSLIPVAKIAQAKRRKVLSGARVEEFYQQQTAPYDLTNPQLQNFCELLTATVDQDETMTGLNPAV